MKRWTIYCHTHIESGRRYIGLTSHTMMHRWNQHCSQAKNSKGGRWYFPNAIRKYGKDAFSHEVLAMSRDLEGANATEEAIIEQENTRDPKFGFNLMKGGSHTPHPIRRNPWDRPEYREKQNGVVLRFHTPQARAANKAALNTSESRAKRIEISRHIQALPDVKRKISIAAKKAHRDGRCKPPILTHEIIEKNASRSRGRKFSDKARMNIKLAAVGRSISNDCKAKIAKTISEKAKTKFQQDGSPTNKLCKVHGIVPIENCYVRTGESDTGRPYLICKKCKNSKVMLRYHASKNTPVVKTTARSNNLLK